MHDRHTFCTYQAPKVLTLALNSSQAIVSIRQAAILYSGILATGSRVSEVLILVPLPEEGHEDHLLLPSLSSGAIADHKPPQDKFISSISTFSKPPKDTVIFPQSMTANLMPGKVSRTVMLFAARKSRLVERPSGICSMK